MYPFHWILDLSLKEEEVCEVIHGESGLDRLVFHLKINMMKRHAVNLMIDLL